MTAPRLLTVQDAAGYCGLSVRAFTKDMPVPAVKIGSVRRWDKAALDAYIDGLSGCSTTQKPIDWYDRAQNF